MKDQAIEKNKKVRRILKAVFISAALLLFLGTLVGTNLGDVRDTGASISNAFAVLFGIMGASLGATLARSLVKIPPPSKKLLIIVSISCGAGFVLGALLSGIILHLAFALSLIMGVISIIVGIVGYIFTYTATIVTFAASPFATAIGMADGTDPMAAELRDMIRKDKTGLKEVAFSHALSDLEEADRES